jgi:hypothetical protein
MVAFGALGGALGTVVGGIMLVLFAVVFSSKGDGPRSMFPEPRGGFIRRHAADHDRRFHANAGSLLE